jgi:hypothetical protein
MAARTTPIGLTSDEIAALRAITVDGTTHFADGYAKILEFLAVEQASTRIQLSPLRARSESMQMIFQA